MQPQSAKRIITALEMLMSANTSADRSLQTIRRYSLSPDRIDDAVLAAINASLCLVSNGEMALPIASTTTSPPTVVPAPLSRVPNF